MKSKQTHLNNQQGFALITAIMMLFAATVLGLTVMNSAEIEILISGAQQRYEGNFNTSEGAASAEAAAIGTAATITRAGNTRSYAVVNPGIENQVLSPSKSTTAMFDPGNDMSADDDLPLYTVTMSTEAELWPMDNLLQSDDNGDDPLDYHYRTVYLYPGEPPKGDDASKFSGYHFQINAQRTTQIEMGANKSGPKFNY